MPGNFTPGTPLCFAQPTKSVDVPVLLINDLVISDYYSTWSPTAITPLALYTLQQPQFVPYSPPLCGCRF